MENTQNERQALKSPSAGGSNQDCPVPGKRVTHQVMLLPSRHLT